MNDDRFVVIEHALAVLHEPGTVIELRVLHTRRGTVSGYFTDAHLLAETAGSLDGTAPAVYVTLNPVDPTLLARAANHTVEFAKHTTADQNIVRRRWIPFDFDPIRAAGISSTDAEHKAALDRGEACRGWLIEQGVPEGAIVMADSGNGAHLLLRVDLPNDAASLALVTRCLETVAFRWSDDAVAVDVTTGNAARILKLYGTLSAKGDSLPDRPHRRSALLTVPFFPEIASVDCVAAFAALAPKTSASVLDRDGPRGVFDLDRWLTDYQERVIVVGTGAWNGGRKFILKPCPWNPEHTNGAAYIVQHPSGAISAGCHHNGCAGKNWYALRDLVEPGWRERRAPAPSPAPVYGASAGARANGERHVGDGHLSPATPLMASWPAPLAEEAFHGLAGDLVRILEPHTEADPAALLLQLLVAGGNAIGRGAHFIAEDDRHGLNLFAALVGDTSKGRKGASWGRIHRLLAFVDSSWTTSCIQSGLSSGEGLIWAVRDPIERRDAVKEHGRVVDYETVVADPGVTDKRLLVLEPEFSRTLRVMDRDGNTLSPVIRQAWDTGTLRVLTKTTPAKATNAHISIIGHVTRDELRRYLTTTEAGNGFANRFLWCCVRRSKVLPEGGAQVLDEKLADGLRASIRFSQSCGEITRDDGARAIWRDVYAELSEGHSGLHGAVTSRSEAQVMRLACLYAVLDQSAVVSKEHLLAALAVWDYVDESCRYIFGQLLGDNVADRILEQIQAAQTTGVTRTEIRDLFGRNVREDVIDRALGVLKGRALAWPRIEKTAGRPSERWFAASVVPPTAPGVVQ
jgi:hypothetical protein